MGEAVVHPDVAALWSWEGRVQHAIAEFLRADGWTNIVEADTGRRAHGTDIYAERRSRRLAVEVKGLPASVYARGARAGRPKPTKPGLQAHHWFAQAILQAMKLQAMGTMETAIGLPAHAPYLELLRTVDRSIRRAQIGVLLVDEHGNVGWRDHPGGVAAGGGREDLEHLPSCPAEGTDDRMCTCNLETIHRLRGEIDTIRTTLIEPSVICGQLTQWAGVAGIQRLRSDGVLDDSGGTVVGKSDLLNRLVYGGEAGPSQTPCPVHRGRWNGCQAGWPGDTQVRINADGTTDIVPARVVPELATARAAGCRCSTHRGSNCTTGWNPDEHCCDA